MHERQKLKEQEEGFGLTGTNEENTESQKVVMFEYPRKGIWVVGFSTKSNSGEISVKTKEELINVFVPTTPNPTSGFFVIIPKKDAIELKMSVEEAFKLVISAGVVTPQTLKIKGK